MYPSGLGTRVSHERFSGGHIDITLGKGRIGWGVALPAPAGPAWKVWDTVSSDERSKLAEACRFLDIVTSPPWRGPEGFYTVEQIQAVLSLSKRGVYKLIHRHLIPKGGVRRKGQGNKGRAGRFLVSRKTLASHLVDRMRRPRRNRLTTDCRLTRSGPRAVVPKPSKPVMPKPVHTAEFIYHWEHLTGEERKAIIKKVFQRGMTKRPGKHGRAGPSEVSGTSVRTPPSQTLGCSLGIQWT